MDRYPWAMLYPIKVHQELLDLVMVAVQERLARKDPPSFVLAGGPGSSLIRPEIFMYFSPVFLGPLMGPRDAMCSISVAVVAGVTP
jgi:hypothetical protein